MMQQLLSQVVTTIAKRPKGSLPSQPKPNSKGKGVYEPSTLTQHVNAITTLRSGKKVDNHVKYVPELDKSVEDEIHEQSQQGINL
ncbi:hypothetical protein FRX31_030729 [Thalictrum thalictroides]|uniref:Uncharacterized protein n=1 Tax=Thalictrum thalictroides TaxID=46969 RepID=A0A7J6V3N6_THATH|nr:hypothetical protein FRX31_030729 [Thalictrum thalictroides]